MPHHELEYPKEAINAVKRYDTRGMSLAISTSGRPT
jgi:hypothetical protein